MTRVYAWREADGHADLILRNGNYKEDVGRVKVDFEGLENHVSSIQRDLAYVAAALFTCEELQNNERSIKFAHGDWIRFLVSSAPIWKKRDIADRLQEIFSFATKSSLRPRFDTLLPTNDSKAVKSARSVSLFSGGVDSLCGVLSLPNALKPTVGIFVSHAKMRGIVETITSLLQEVQIHTVSIQRNMAEIQQLRGFLYLSFAGILAKLVGTSSVVIAETGPTMYQPQYLPTDLVTVTTNPLLVELTKRLVDQVLDCKLQIYEPFENMTKAETMAICPQKSLINRTNSCITSRFSQEDFPHCGRCLGCVIRRLSEIVADVEDSGYAWDVVMMDVGDKIKAVRLPSQSFVREHDMDNLLMLLRFARGMMTDRLPPYTASIIHDYRKEELFRRFALDIFAAVHLLSAQTRNRYIRKFNIESISGSIVTKHQLEERIAQVREERVTPNFNPRFI
jgi:7-cyano-7-deazaguanine synthase in queuosine biosynthesis